MTRFDYEALEYWLEHAKDGSFIANIINIDEKDAPILQYLAHAANRYPGLVDALDKCYIELRELSECSIKTTGGDYIEANNVVIAQARAVLAKTQEAK